MDDILMNLKTLRQAIIIGHEFEFYYNNKIYGLTHYNRTGYAETGYQFSEDNEVLKYFNSRETCAEQIDTLKINDEFFVKIVLESLYEKNTLFIF